MRKVDEDCCLVKSKVKSLIGFQTNSIPEINASSLCKIKDLSTEDGSSLGGVVMNSTLFKELTPIVINALTRAKFILTDDEHDLSKGITNLHQIVLDQY